MLSNKFCNFFRISNFPEASIEITKVDTDNLFVEEESSDEGPSAKKVKKRRACLKGK